MKNFSLKMKHLRKSLRNWNWEVFGDLNRKENNLLEGTETFKKNLDMGWNVDTFKKLNESRSEFENVLLLKESMTKDKARIGWLQEGERNSAFFHASIKARRIRNYFQLQIEY